ncbi:hypothetical protein QL285_064536 [Trifolium repens]|nr:hypothetical protein QL285_064536 [Trifolium repens]
MTSIKYVAFYLVVVSLQPQLHQQSEASVALTAMRMMGELEWKPWVEQPDHAWRHAQLLVVDAIMKVMAYCDDCVLVIWMRLIRVDGLNMDNGSG